MWLARLTVCVLLCALVAKPAQGTPGSQLACVLVVDMTRRTLAEQNETDVKDAVGLSIRDDLRDDLVSLSAVVNPLPAPTALMSGRDYRAAVVNRALSATDRARYSGSPLWDAVVNATALLASRPVGTAPLIILYSSGEVGGNRASLEDAVAAARAAGVKVSAMAYSRRDRAIVQVPSGAVLMPRPDLLLRHMVVETGGFFVDSPVPYTDGLRQEFSRIVRETRKRGG